MSVWSFSGVCDALVVTLVNGVRDALVVTLVNGVRDHEHH
jgi:hypothetical protein